MSTSDTQTDPETLSYIRMFFGGLFGFVWLLIMIGTVSSAEYAFNPYWIVETLLGISIFGILAGLLFYWESFDTNGKESVMTKLLALFTALHLVGLLIGLNGMMSK